MTPQQYNLLKTMVIDLALIVIKLVKVCPERTGGYTLELEDFMKEIGRERLSAELAIAIVDYVTKMVGNSATEVVLDKPTRILNITFNNKLAIHNGYICFGNAAMHKLPAGKKF